MRRLLFLSICLLTMALCQGVAAAGGSEVALDTAMYRGLETSARARLESFPLPGVGAVDIELSSFPVTSHGSRWIVVDEDGPREEALDLRAFRGRVVGDPDSRVVLTLGERGLWGIIETAEGSFNVDGRSGLSLVRSIVDDPASPQTPMCHDALPGVVVPDSPTAAGLAGGTAVGVTSTTPLVAGIAIDSTHEWYLHHGSETAARDYILNLMAQVSAIYMDEIGVRLEVAYLRTFATADDPYSSTQDVSTLLAELRSEWNTNQSSVQRAAVQLFGRRTSGGSGIAYLDVLCNHDRFPGASFDYGVSTMTANGASWERKLVAHELGHNFSSPHTHCYVPEIDRCSTQSGCWSGSVESTQGTIMSYCSNSSPVFHERVEDERLRPAAEAAAQSCIGIDGGGTVPDPPAGVTVR